MKKLLYALLISLAFGNAVVADNTQLLSEIDANLAALTEETKSEELVTKGKIATAKDKVVEIKNKLVQRVVKDHPYISAAAATALVSVALVVFAKLVDNKWGKTTECLLSGKNGVPIMDGVSQKRGFKDNWIRFGYNHSVGYLDKAANSIDTKTKRFGWDAKWAKDSRGWTKDKYNNGSKFVGEHKRSVIGGSVVTGALVVGFVVYAYKYLKANKPELLERMHLASENGTEVNLDEIIQEIGV